MTAARAVAECGACPTCSTDGAIYWHHGRCPGLAFPVEHKGPVDDSPRTPLGSLV